MSGESDWTIRTLKKHFDRRFKDQDRAVSKALAATEKRFDSVNEFRQTLADQQTTFVRNDVANTRFTAIEAQIARITDRETEVKARGDGRNDVWGRLLAIVAIAISAVALFFKLKG